MKQRQGRDLGDTAKPCTLVSYYCSYPLALLLYVLTWSCIGSSLSCACARQSSKNKTKRLRCNISAFVVVLFVFYKGYIHNSRPLLPSNHPGKVTVQGCSLFRSDMSTFYIPLTKSTVHIGVWVGVGSIANHGYGPRQQQCTQMLMLHPLTTPLTTLTQSLSLRHLMRSCLEPSQALPGLRVSSSNSELSSAIHTIGQLSAHKKTYHSTVRIAHAHARRIINDVIEPSWFSAVRMSTQEHYLWRKLCREDAEGER